MKSHHFNSISRDCGKSASHYEGVGFSVNELNLFENTREAILRMQLRIIHKMFYSFETLFHYLMESIHKRFLIVLIPTFDSSAMT